MSQIEHNLLAFSTGLAVALIIYSIWDCDYWQCTHIPDATRHKSDDHPELPPSKLEDILSLHALAELSKSGNLLLQDSATQILLDRAMSEEFLPHILKACTLRNDPMMLRMGIHALQQLAQEEDNRSILVRMRGLKILVKALSYQTGDDTKRYAISAIFSLVSNDERRKGKIVQYGVLVPLIHFLSATPKLNSDLKYWALLLLHQISICEEMHPIMVKHNIVELLARVARLTFGNTNINKIEAPAQLTILIDMKMINIIAACLRHDDVELVSWAVFLLHEFTVKDIAKDRILAINGLFKTFSLCLSNNETVIARITLRIIKCLCSGNIKFQCDLVRAKLLVPLIVALKSKDSEAQYWAMAVMHELTSRDCKGLDTLTHAARAAPRHVLLYIADMLVYLCGNASNQDRLAESDMTNLIISFCHSPDSEIQYAGAALILNAATLSARLCQQIAAQNGIEILDSYLNDSHILPNQLVAVKALLTIAVKDPLLRFQITVFTVRPLILRLPQKAIECVELIFPDRQSKSHDDPEKTSQNGLSERYMMGASPLMESPLSSSEGGSPYRHRAGTLSRYPVNTKRINSSQALHACKNVQHLLACLFILLDTDIFDQVDNDSNEQPLQDYISDCFDETCSSLLDLLALPLVNQVGDVDSSPISGFSSMSKLNRHCQSLTEQKPLEGSSAGENLKESEKLDLPSQEGHKAPLLPSSSISEMLEIDQNHAELLQQLDLCEIAVNTNDLDTAKIDIAICSLRCIGALVKYEYVMKTMIREKLVAILIGLIGLKNKALRYQALITLSLSVKRGLSVQEIINIRLAFITILQFAISENSQTLFFYLNILLENICCFGSDDPTPLEAFDILNSARTSGLSIACQTQEVRNDDWTFQSLRMNMGVSMSGRYAFDFIVRTVGIIQIGWASDKCVFDPEAGTGIGDNVHSYAFDGHRIKKWHGTSDDNSYGCAWSAGDTITSVIDLNQGTISFHLNGTSMGIAFSDIDVLQTWCPAISLTSEQCGYFRFGGPLDPLIFPPVDALPIAHYANEEQQSSSWPDSPERIPSPNSNVVETDTLLANDPTMIETAVASPLIKILDTSLLTAETVSSLSLYFEVKVNTGKLDMIKCPQIGMLLQDDHMIITCLERHSNTLVWLKIQGIHFDDEHVFEDQLCEHLRLMMDPARDGVYPSPTEEIEVIYIMRGVNWHPGDIIGCGLYLHEQGIFFTMNGEPIGPIVFSSRIQTAVCIPYIRHIPRFVLNVFETEFKWEPANADRFRTMTWKTACG
ncbi:hypothetical protein BASA81_009398 [Batrachochytrium salamandrivorans]|nr:hypothetical protein BASA81_009398 [Batrachochytrium salamandrivorans]